MAKETNMIYAPVLIPTLCRYDHFVRCIESLKKNTWAKYTDIYIGLDYPKNKYHWEGYEKICKYLEGDFCEFKSFNVIKRKENYGSLKNMIELREDVFKNFDRVIRTDDDAEFSRNFLEYMNKNLMYYENRKDIIAVTGYSYPIEWIVDREATVFESNFIFPMWGTGLWREKYREFEHNLRGGYLRSNFKRYIKNIKKYKLLDSKFIDYVNNALSFTNDNFIDNISDVSLGIYLSLDKKSIIMPKTSKVRNHGFDGSGEYCQNIDQDSNKSENYSSSNYNYSKQPIDNKDFYTLVPSKKNNLDVNRTLMNEFDLRSNYLIRKTKLKLFIYKVCGEKKYKKILYIKSWIKSLK